MWTVDIGAEYGEVRPLDAARMRTLAINGVQLLDRIVADVVFVTELATVGCITWPQREHIIEITHSRDRNDKLLEFLTRRSVADFQKFINVLSKEQAYLVPLLVTDGGKMFWTSLIFMTVTVFVFSSVSCLWLIMIIMAMNRSVCFSLPTSPSFIQCC